MSKIKSYLKLMRIKHWLKNIIIFIPAFFGGAFIYEDKLLALACGFVIFSLCSSSIYIINDICDIERDRKHPVKCLRPLAYGSVKISEGCILLIICFLSAITINIFTNGISIETFIPIIYFFINIFYSKILKNLPVADLAVLVSGFVLRMIYGAFIASVKISTWLYLTLISLSLFMAFGKRRNEKFNLDNASRKVLDSYNEIYLNSCMYMYLALFLVFYALWSVDSDVLTGMKYTTPFVIIMVMRYTYLLENDKYGDPIDMIISDKPLIILSIIYTVFIFINIYIPEAFYECLRF